MLTKARDMYLNYQVSHGWLINCMNVQVYKCFLIDWIVSIQIQGVIFGKVRNYQACVSDGRTSCFDSLEIQ